MTDIREQARQALDGITPGPWKWYDDRHHTLEGRGGVPDVYEYDTEVLEIGHHGECGCRSACELEVDIAPVDAEFIAAAPTLVAGLLAELERVDRGVGA
jgi:hypothetical protein